MQIHFQCNRGGAFEPCAFCDGLSFIRTDIRATRSEYTYVADGGTACRRRVFRRCC